MSAAASASPGFGDTQGLPRRDGHGSSRRDSQSYASPSRTQSTRSRPSAVTPSPVRANSSHSRPSPRRVDDILPQQDYETTSVGQSSRKRSGDWPSHSRTESTRSGHQRSSSRQHPTSDMAGAADATNGAGPAPVVVPLQQKQPGRQGRSRTVIPAQTGNWMLGKTIGAGSMGKVKLARRAEGGEEVGDTRANILVSV